MIAVVLMRRFEIIKEKTYFTILSPRAQEVWREGEIREIRWASFGIKKVRIALAIGGHDKGFLGDDGNEFVISAKPGKYTWKIPSGFVTGFSITKTEDMRIRFYDALDDRFWGSVVLLFRELIQSILKKNI
jgi:hypothetical protein